MEKRKLLLVAVSVGVFLVIVIGAAILVFTPRGPSPAPVARAQRPPIQAGAAGTLGTSSGSPSVLAGVGSGNAPGTAPFEQAQTQPATVDPSEMVRNSDGYQGLQAPPLSSSSSSTPSSTTAIQQENNFYINNDIPNQPVLIERNADDTTTVVINVPRPITAAVPDAPPTSRSSSPSVQRQAAQKAAPVPAAKPPAAAPAKGSTQSQAAVKAPTPQTPAAKAPVQNQGRTYDTYWIQTGSFSSKTRAEGAKESLASKGITAIIESKLMSDTTYYRVRVGPYTSQKEADFWLSNIKTLQGFEQSQVWKNPVKR